MQRLEVSGAVRPIYGSLGVKRFNPAACWLIRAFAGVAWNVADGYIFPAYKVLD